MTAATRPIKLSWYQRAVDIAAVLLLAPTVLTFGFYVLSEKMLERWPNVPLRIEQCLQRIRDLNPSTYRCYPVMYQGTFRRYGPDGPPIRCSIDVASSIGGFNRPGFLGFRGDLMYAVRDVAFPLTEQFFAANELSDKLRGRVSVWYFHHKKLCQAASPRDLEEVQRKAGAQVVAFREELQRRWTPVKEAMARYQKNRLKVALLAWSLFLFELVAFLWGSWFYVRRYLAKQRTAGAG